MRRSLPLRILLVPLSLLYSILNRFRNFLYDKNILKPFDTGIPVISVGNITTGGTGKTPLTLLIADHLLAKGVSVAVVSRGYGRRGSEFQIVCDGERIIAGVEDSGDELALISGELLSRHPGLFVVAAGADRAETIERLKITFSPDVVILDDAFQHRKVHRDLDIVLINAEEFVSDKMSHSMTIPSGNLREPMSGLARANILVQNNKFSDIEKIQELLRYDRDLYEMRYNSECYVDFENVIISDLKKPAIAFSGLADNGSFTASLKANGINVSSFLEFEDHHSYTESDIERITSDYTGKEVFITTQKDFVKIRKFESLMTGYPVYFMKITPSLNQGEMFFESIESVLK